MKRVFLTILLLGCMTATAYAQTTAAKVVSVKGRALVKAKGAKDADATVLREHAELIANQQVMCGKGCRELTISYCERSRPKVIGARWITIINVPCFANEHGPIGGRTKGLGTIIELPRENEVVRPATFHIKWNPGSSGTTQLSVKVLFKTRIWGPTLVSIKKDGFSAPSLVAKLKEAQNASGLNLLLVTDRNGERESDSVEFRLITVTDEHELNELLQSFETESDVVLRLIARGLTFYRYELYRDAVNDFEKAFSLVRTRRIANTSELKWVMELAITANRDTGNDKRVKQLCASWMDSEPVPKACTQPE